MTSSAGGPSWPARAVTAVTAACLALAAVTYARDDDELEREARTRIAESQELYRRSIDVSVEDAVAVITGRVETLAERRKAMRVVGRVTGLDDVVARLAVQSAGRSDSRVKGELVRTFRNRLALLDSGVEVTVSSGVCTLSGVVRDGRTKSAARRAALDVPGVVEVVDRLSTREVPDELLQKRAERLFARRGRIVIAGRFDVVVRDGVLLLTGDVPRPYERMIAEELPLGITGLRGLAARIDVVPPPDEVPVMHPH